MKFRKFRLRDSRTDSDKQYELYKSEVISSEKLE